MISWDSKTSADMSARQLDICNFTISRCNQNTKDNCQLKCNRDNYCFKILIIVVYVYIDGTPCNSDLEPSKVRYGKVVASSPLSCVLVCGS